MPVSIDTGSNDGVELVQTRARYPGNQGRIGSDRNREGRPAHVASTPRKSIDLNAPISLGPFTLAAGQRVTFSGNRGSATTRLANVGNRVFADMNIKLLLDYRDARIGFYGECPK